MSSRMVDHPSHYNRGGIEVIDMMERVWGRDALTLFCEMNAFKYRMRAGLKGDAGEDIEKAMWYEGKAEELRGQGEPEALPQGTKPGTGAGMEPGGEALGTEANPEAEPLGTVAEGRMPKAEQIVPEEINKAAERRMQEAIITYNKLKRR